VACCADEAPEGCHETLANSFHVAQPVLGDHGVLAAILTGRFGGTLGHYAPGDLCQGFYATENT
jgi:hypothetical protein